MNDFPTIWTSHWAAELPPTITRIAVSRGTPRTQKGFKRYRRLEPGPWWNHVDEREYCRLYLSEVLSPLDPRLVVADLARLSGNGPLALICWEAPATTPCHRAIIGWWLNEKLGMNIREFDLPGIGLEHPLIPPSLTTLL